MERLTYDRLRVSVYPSRAAMGGAAAEAAARFMRAVAEERGVVNMIFAAAPSQDEFLETLVSLPGLPWGKAVAMHMDEYIGLGAKAPQRFARYLDDHVFSKVPFRQVHRLTSSAADPAAECERYAAILRSNPVDIVCMGVGENGHIAFNDPPVADFADSALVKVVRLDQRCREQQVHDRCFERLDDVPARAMTLTVPALLAASHIVCVVPGDRKADAVRNMLEGEIATACPASILRTHPSAELFLDAESCAALRR